MFAASHKVDNLIAFVDWNKQQLDGFTKDILDMGDIGDKFRSFGWFVQQVNGHDVDAILGAVIAAKEHKGLPSVIILDTVKGYGTFAAGLEGNHHMSLSKEQMDETIRKVTEKLEEARAVVAADEAVKAAAAAAEEAVRQAAWKPEEPAEHAELSELSELGEVSEEAAPKEGEDNVQGE